MNQRIIPAITSVKKFEKFLETDYEYCVLMNLHISLLKTLVEKAHDKGKKCFLHLDLINGISSDEYGVEYAVQHIKIDGIVSTRNSVIKAAQRKKIVSIYRIFLIDSMSLNRSLEKLAQLKPDYVELLPAIAFDVMSRVKKETDIPIIGGGLIASREDIDRCIASGMIAVTTSNRVLW
ncbi:glycerol-3-phosphate responsive antiterminator [Mycoplasmatota bacterium]|nr:glycerol-3-phosphate responsive antiterminator [Mycoplasmatota bacterium]